MVQFKMTEETNFSIVFLFLISQHLLNLCINEWIHKHEISKLILKHDSI